MPRGGGGGSRMGGRSGGGRSGGGGSRSVSPRGGRGVSPRGTGRGWARSGYSAWGKGGGGRHYPWRFRNFNYPRTYYAPLYGGYDYWPGYYYDYNYNYPITQLQSQYGSCDCDLNGNVITNNNCTLPNYPQCAANNCTCVSPVTGNYGCQNNTGAIC